MAENSVSAPQRILAVVTTSRHALSTRQVAVLANVAPTTASRLLRELEAQQLVTSASKGRATLWRGTPAASAVTSAEPATTTRSALILTALALETSAIKSLLPGGESFREPNGVRSYQCTLVGRHITWEIRVLQAGVGNAAAAAASAQSLKDFSPDIILFVGVAGGLKADEQRHGDVVVVNRAYNASGGKESDGPGGEALFLTRPVSEGIPLALEELAGEIAATMPGTLQVSIGAVASTEAVLGTVQGPLYQRIRSNMNDCVIVDMESFGVLIGARRLGLPAVSVRGISDFVADKTASLDGERQPAAARNAAKVALRFLRDADPDDVHPSNRQRPELVVPGKHGEPDRVTQLEHSALPGSAEPWHQLLASHDPERAQAAEIELLSWRRGAIATHASRIVDRPPEWLRSDPTGQAWAIVAAVAETAGAGVTSRAHAEAARRAQGIGHQEVAGLQTVSTDMARTRESVARGADEVVADAELLSRLEDLDLTHAPAAACFRDLLLAQGRRQDGDWSRAIEAAATALSLLGVDPKDAGIEDADSLAPTVNESGREASAGDGPQSAPASDLPEPIRRLLAGRVALQLATIRLYEERGLQALQAADLAIRLLPISGNAKLRRGQALLTILHEGSAAIGIGRASDVLSDVERLGLEAHAVLTEWDADASEALALAGRARMEAGDPRGALRLLRPPPDGTASPNEAASDHVGRVLVPAALMAGDHDLALRASGRLANGTESLLMKAQALERAPGMRNEARDAYREALRGRQRDQSVLERALLGLARTGEPLHEVRSSSEPTDTNEPRERSKSSRAREESDGKISTRDVLKSALDEAYEVSPRIADLAVGEAALRSGDPERALIIALRYRDHVQGIELVADAHEAAGRSQESLDALWDFGTVHGDVTLQLEAMMRAGRLGDFERVVLYADAIIRDYAGEPRRMARRARVRASGLTNDWPGADAQAAMLLSENEGPDSALTESETNFLRWTRVEALFHMHKARGAFDALMQPAPLSVATRQEALLALATTHALVQESPSLADSAVEWILGLASTWLDDEEVCRQAIGILLLMGGDTDLAQVARARDVIGRYFERHKDDAQIRQIEMAGEIDDDGEVPEGYFEPLYEELRRSAQTHDPAMRKIELEVWRGRVPWAFLIRMLGRSYAGTLIQGGLGQYVVSSQWSPAPTVEGVAIARDAVTQGAVSIDTSSLVVGPKLGVSRRALLGLFKRVHLAEALRADMFRARAELGRRSDMTLGWDSRAERPRVDVADAQEVDRWAKEAADLCLDLSLMTVHPPEQSSDGTHGLDPLLLAAKVDVPLWADDAALRTLATEKGIASFTTFDLLSALREMKTVMSLPTPEEVRALAIAARVVETTLSGPWWVLARNDDWRASGGIALAISRPAAWTDEVASFAEFRRLIEVLGRQPSDIATDENLAGWAHAAAHGLAWRAHPAARATMVANLLTWVILQMEPTLSPRRIVHETTGLHTEYEGDHRQEGQLLNLIFSSVQNIGNSAFPEADAVRELTTTLAGTVRSVADAQTTMRLMLGALSTLQHEATREHALKALLAYPPTPSQD